MPAIGLGKRPPGVLEDARAQPGQAGQTEILKVHEPMNVRTRQRSSGSDGSRARLRNIVSSGNINKISIMLAAPESLPQVEFRAWNEVAAGGVMEPGPLDQN
jgi:hypothetical protein